MTADGDVWAAGLATVIRGVSDTSASPTTRQRHCFGALYSSDGRPNIHRASSRTMKDSTHYSVKWGGLLCELCTLPMLYSAVLLDPFPYDWVRISGVALTAALSLGFAYVSNSRFRRQNDSSRLSFKQTVFRLPLVVWGAAVVVIVIQLALRVLWIMPAALKADWLS